MASVLDRQIQKDYLARIVARRIKEQASQCRVFPLREIYPVAVVARSQEASHRFFCRLANIACERQGMWQYLIPADLSEDCPRPKRLLHLVELQPVPDSQFIPVLWIEVKESEHQESLFPYPAEIACLTETIYGNYITTGELLRQDISEYEVFLAFQQVLESRDLVYKPPSTSDLTVFPEDEMQFSIGSQHSTIRRSKE